MRAYSYSVADATERRLTSSARTVAWMAIGFCVSLALGFWVAS